MLDQEEKLSLMDHLQELRARLWKVVTAVLVLGGGALFFAREIFEVLMRPVLAALPEESRSLVYTSGIEELNVLLKVGLYAGLFLAAPVALYQLWAFIAPGLLKSEKRLIAPFVTLGTLFFLGGAVFCYFAVLPSMFELLLRPGESGPVRARVVASRAKADDSVRLFFAGQPAQASALAQAAVGKLGGGGEGSIASPLAHSASHQEITERLTRFGKLLDVAIPLAREGAPREAVARAVQLHHDAEELVERGELRTAGVKLEDAAAALEQAWPDQAGQLGDVWAAQRHLAAAAGKLVQEEWTRPMLTMREQLSLVLMLELAFGAIFELPLIMAALAVMGLLKFRWVAKYQRHAILACVAVAAIVSPTGDVINLSLMAVPMVVCFELGVLLVWIFERRRNAASSEETPETGATSA